MALGVNPSWDREANQFHFCRYEFMGFIIFAKHEGTDLYTADTSFYVKAPTSACPGY